MLIQTKSSTYDPTHVKKIISWWIPGHFIIGNSFFFILQSWLSLPTNSTHLPMWFRNLDGLHVRDTKTSLQTPLKHYWYDMHSFPFVWQQYKRLQSPPPLCQEVCIFTHISWMSWAHARFKFCHMLLYKAFFFFQEWDYSWVITL